MSILNDKHKAAEDAWTNYDFGDLWVTVTDSEGFDTSDKLDFTRIAYLEESGAETSLKVSFHVRFNEQGFVTEVYALDVGSGNYVGIDPIARVPMGNDGRIWSIDPRKFNRNSGYVIVMAQMPSGATQYLLTTDIIAVRQRVEEVGGKIVNATTNFEEIINSQYDGIAVLSTELGE